MEECETAARRQQFDEMHSQLLHEWETLRSSEALRAFLNIRDKATAHTELRPGQEIYHRLDVASLGLKWSDLRDVIQQIQDLTDELNLLIRQSSFVWPMLDEQLEADVSSFWN